MVSCKIFKRGTGNSIPNTNVYNLLLADLLNDGELSDTSITDNKDLEKNKIRSALMDLTIDLQKQVKKISSDIPKIAKNDIGKIPYKSFLTKFRQVVDPFYISSSKSYILGFLNRKENSNHNF